jgi:hypothetical protein
MYPDKKEREKKVHPRKIQENERFGGEIVYGL